ncbi:hypothetical protein SAMN05216276_10778 [Streptosporangium subroseum]|uniref:Uncharacterized protein n=1 Tax=Streptosporangium subroseum TaxID=106412 RepID=A0A239NZU9_9ACTN|nr:hypothetical protein [Streptosporangium subroseum]SNT60290.1 hypothetical protein SAMN05216276_10778 [Streptosporangium subroseum]
MVAEIGAMGGDLAILAVKFSPYVTAGIGAYGGSVLTQAQEDAADATAKWGRRILQRIFGVQDVAEATPEVVADLVGDPGNGNLEAAL